MGKGNARRLMVAGAVILGSVLLSSCSPPCSSGDSAPSTEFLDEEAAINMARQCGLQGLASGWTADLREYPRFGPVWDVRSTLYETGDRRGGQHFVIDARTGVLVDSLGWGEIWGTGGIVPAQQVVPVKPAEASN